MIEINGRNMVINLMMNLKNSSDAMVSSGDIGKQGIIWQGKQLPNC